ncbi:MAG: hypothetical protein A2132_01815 [Nitrospirae bacterium RBG_16_43_11]|nr:MAG: hypothetical protein A2132_01815 [Nitrospirae bacterium RBG_16_43_11]
MKIPALHFSIRLKLILIVAGLLFISIAGSGYLIRSMVFQNILDQKIKTAEILTKSVVHDIKYVHQIQRSENIDQVIAKFITYYRIITNISYYNSESVIVADSNPENIGQSTNDNRIADAVSMAKPSIIITKSDWNNVGIRSISPILQGSKIMGAVEVDISIGDVQMTISAIDRRVAMILVVAVLSSSAALYFLLRVAILQRLNRLMNITNEVSAGNYNVQAEDKSWDEIGQLSKAFNSMTSDLKISKNELENYNKTLEDRVKEATARLTKTYDDLKNTQTQLVLNEKMASLGLLIAGIAHEINTPIGAIFNVTRTLDNRVVSLPGLLRDFRMDDENLHDKMMVCLDELYRVSKVQVYSPSFREIRAIEAVLSDQGLVNYKTMSATLARLNFTDREKILTYIDCFKAPSFFALFESCGSIMQAANISKSSSQKISEIVRALKFYAYTDRDKIEAVQINESIQTALILLRSKLKHGISVMTDFAKDLPEIMCTSEIHQVWTNILNNACDAIVDMGSDYKGEIFIISRRSDDSIIISISDNGVGIPEDKKDNIFDPFFTTKDIGKGTGLGLSIVSGIIKKQGGIIHVDSRRGHTKFEVILPVKIQDCISIDHDNDVLMTERDTGAAVS